MIADNHSLGRTGFLAIANDLFRLVVKAILESELGFTQVVIASSLEDVLGRLSDVEGVGLAIFDLSISGMTDAYPLSILRECFPDIRLVVSGPMRRADMLHALHAGVHGYISDAMSVQDLTPALARVVAGKIFVPDIVADVAPHSLNRLATMARSQRRDVLDMIPPQDSASPFELTPRQQDVLRLIVQGQSNKEIARTLNLRESTVKVHLAAIFRILGVHNRSGAAGVGIQLISPAGGSILGHRGKSPTKSETAAHSLD